MFQSSAVNTANSFQGFWNVISSQTNWALQNFRWKVLPFAYVSFVLCPPFIIKEKEMSVSVSGDFDQNIKLLKGTADIVINFSFVWSISKIVCNHQQICCVYKVYESRAKVCTPIKYTFTFLRLLWPCFFHWLKIILYFSLSLSFELNV